MNMNVYYHNKPKMQDITSTQLRKELVNKVSMPRKLVDNIIRTAMKQGSFVQGGLRVVVINHPKHHAKKVVNMA